MVTIPCFSFCPEKECSITVTYESCHKSIKCAILKKDPRHQKREKRYEEGDFYYTGNGWASVQYTARESREARHSYEGFHRQSSPWRICRRVEPQAHRSARGGRGNSYYQIHRCNAYLLSHRIQDSLKAYFSWKSSNYQICREHTGNVQIHVRNGMRSLSCAHVWDSRGASQIKISNKKPGSPWFFFYLNHAIQRCVTKN